MAQQSQSSPVTTHVNTRVDKPHLLRREQLVPPNPPAEQELHLLAGCDAVGLVNQLQRQAHELGHRLQTQQKDLDRRESEFHAQIAKIENELRIARLVCLERESELNERLRQPATERTGGPAAALESPLQRAPMERAHRVDPAQSTEVAELRSLCATQRGERIMDPSLGDDWEARLGELEKSERELQAQLAQSAYDRRQLDTERAALVASRNQQEQQSQAALAESKLEFEQELLRLQSWSQKLDRRNSAVEQLHQEASRMVREALEMRLCTEQLWSEINESASPAETTQRLSELRCQLMDQFHLASVRAREQKSELESLIQRLVEHQATLRQQRDELRQWIARRHAEIEADATKLLARERDLNRQDTEVKRMKDEWAEQRHDYEQKIRRLNRLVNSSTM
jgi:hypothetical protein